MRGRARPPYLDHGTSRDRQIQPVPNMRRGNITLDHFDCGIRRDQPWEWVTSGIFVTTITEQQRTNASVVVAIPTKRNSVVISIAQKASKCRNGFLKTLRKSENFPAAAGKGRKFKRSPGYQDAANANSSAAVTSVSLSETSSG